MSRKVVLRKEREEEVPDRPAEGLSDGGHVYLKCSNCKALLVDVYRTRPHEPETWTLQASCPFCGSKSFKTEVRGGFHIGGIATSPKGEPEEDKHVSTIVEPADIQGDQFFFPVKKAHENARPVYRL